MTDQPSAPGAKGQGPLAPGGDRLAARQRNPVHPVPKGRALWHRAGDALVQGTNGGSFGSPVPEGRAARCQRAGPSGTGRGPTCCKLLLLPPLLLLLLLLLHDKSNEHVVFLLLLALRLPYRPRQHDKAIKLVVCVLLLLLRPLYRPLHHDTRSKHVFVSAAALAAAAQAPTSRGSKQTRVFCLLLLLLRLLRRPYVLHQFSPSPKKTFPPPSPPSPPPFFRTLSRARCDFLFVASIQGPPPDAKGQSPMASGGGPLCAKNKKSHCSS